MDLADFVGLTYLQRYFHEISHVSDYIICDCPPILIRSQKIVYRRVTHISFRSIQITFLPVELV